MKRQEGSSRGSATQAIKARLNIADVVRRYVTLQRAGNRWVAPCPFHQETKPSFSVNEEEGFFYCFGCQASGDLFDFYARINGLEFKEALEQLAEEAGVRLEENARNSGGQSGAGDTEFRRAALKMHELAASYFARTMQGEDGQECRAYIEKRRLAPEIIEGFSLGWSTREWRGLADTLRRSGFAPEAAAKAGLLSPSDRGAPYDRFRGRLMFPIRNLSGQTIAFGGRIIADEDAAKYINSADSPLYKKGDHLYGLFQARRSIAAAKSVMLTEGYMDVLTLHQFGYTNACGVLGTALTPEQVKRLAGFCSDLELLFDGDNAGRKAALRSCEMVLAKGLRCRVVLLPEGEDIDSLLHLQGRDAFEALRKSAPEGLDYCVRALSALSPREGVEWVKNFLPKVEMSELLPRYTSILARGLGLDESALRRNAPEAPRPSGGKRRNPIVLPSKMELDPEMKLLRFLVWYPRRLPLMREHGAEVLLTQTWTRELWDKVSAAAPDFDQDQVVQTLTDKEKEFWFQNRMTRPPGENEENEIAEVCESIQRMCQERQKKSCVQALRQTSAGGEYDMELLKALQETVRRSHGER